MKNKELNKEETIKQTVAEFFKVLEIEGDFDFALEEEGIDIELNTKDSGLVIGHHGETLEALQLILSLIINKKVGQFYRVSIEVDGYKKNRIEWLENLAQQTKTRVLAERKEVILSNLKAWERRVIHLFFQEDEEVISESIGEGRDRTLVIKPR